jgi:ABC-type transport system involved in multi-copper enzyme maturation permease subunit
MYHGVITLMSRSLRLEARLLRTHVFRLVFVFFIYMVMLGAWMQSMTRGAPGLFFFSNMLWLNVAFITAGGVSFFASAITEEKEENTLGLLMMTGLSPVGILFGKSTARMLQALILLTVQFPFTLLAITLGGVLMHQVLAAYASLLAFTILLSNLSLLWSVVAKRTGTAAAFTTLCLGFYGFFPFAVPGALAEIAKQPWASSMWGTWLSTTLQGLSDASVFHKLYAITQTGFDEPVIGFQVISNVVAGLACFLLSWALFGRFALHADVTDMSRMPLSRPLGRGRRLAPNRAWSNPLAWKDYHFLAGGKPMLLANLIGLLALYPALYAYFEWQERKFGYYGDKWRDFILTHVIITGCALGLEAAIYASRIFHDEIRWQTMSALLTLPRSIEYIAYSKVAGCLLGLVPVVVLGVVDICLLPPEGPGFLLDAMAQPGVWLAVLVVSTFLHFVVLMSLFVKWGALPLAFLLTFMCFYCCPLMWFAVLATSDSSAAVLVANVILLVLWGVSSFVFQMMIHARLYELGSK